jgi:hypothetical protein
MSMTNKTFHATILLLAAGLVSATLLPANAQRSAADNPSQSQNTRPASDSLQVYEDISALPVPVRKSYFRGTSAANRSDLWKIHLALQLAKRPDLNIEQKEIILAGISLATPELFETPQDVAKIEPIQAFKKRALEGFSKQQMAEIFFTLGSGECKACSDSQLQNEVGRGIGIEPIPNALVSPERGLNTSRALNLPISLVSWHPNPINFSRVADSCTCDSEGCHNWGYDFCGKNNGCDRTSWGCGLFWLNPCTGNYCGTAPPPMDR